jgi:hypothetical protein
VHHQLPLGLQAGRALRGTAVEIFLAFTFFVFFVLVDVVVCILDPVAVLGLFNVEDNICLDNTDTIGGTFSIFCAADL